MILKIYTNFNKLSKIISSLEDKYSILFDKQLFIFTPNLSRNEKNNIYNKISISGEVQIDEISDSKIKYESYNVQDWYNKMKSQYVPDKNKIDQKTLRNMLNIIKSFDKELDSMCQKEIKKDGKHKARVTNKYKKPKTKNIQRNQQKNKK